MDFPSCDEMKVDEPLQMPLGEGCQQGGGKFYSSDYSAVYRAGGNRFMVVPVGNNLII